MIDDRDADTEAGKTLSRALYDRMLKRHGYKLGGTAARHGGMVIEYELIPLEDGVPRRYLRRLLSEIAQDAVVVEGGGLLANVTLGTLLVLAAKGDIGTTEKMR